MSYMAERPTGTLRNEEEAGLTDDGSVDTAHETDPDADAPAGWSATHHTAGGGEAEDEAGNLVTVDADGTVQTFMAADTGVAGPARLPVETADAADTLDEVDLDE